MNRTCRWILVAALTGLGACVLQTETVSGPKGDAGPPGPQGEAGPPGEPGSTTILVDGGPISIQSLANMVTTQQQAIEALQAELSAVGNTANVRSFFPKSIANTHCTSPAKASYVPWTWRGKTGTEICANDSSGPLSCKEVKQVVVTANNSLSPQPQFDPSCNTPLDTPWPWGGDYQTVGILDEEWHHGDVNIVCCN